MDKELNNALDGPVCKLLKHDRNFLPLFLYFSSSFLGPLSSLLFVFLAMRKRRRYMPRIVAIQCISVEVSTIINKSVLETRTERKYLIM